MSYVLLRDYFPNIAERVTPTVTVLDGSELNLPPAQYSLLEMYCDEKEKGSKRGQVYTLHKFNLSQICFTCFPISLSFSNTISNLQLA